MRKPSLSLEELKERGNEIIDARLFCALWGEMLSRLARSPSSARLALYTICDTQNQIRAGYTVTRWDTAGIAGCWHVVGWANTFLAVIFENIDTDSESIVLKDTSLRL